MASPCRERRAKMAKNNKADMSCARVKKYTASDVSKAERHNERKNETYENMNVIEERIPYNVHFKKPFAPTYMEQLKQMETDGMVSLRGLRKDATLFNEIVIDVNTMYFERNGGYEYAKQFYEEAFHFIEEKFGADNVISAVMHADEINVAATEELGKEVYHYHLHAMVLPVVEKEILWSKRCKDEKLRGTVKEVVHQISHSKKWKSDIPLTDEKGNPLLRKNGKPMFRASYSILQDELFNHMTEQGFKGFQRGEYGSTAEHLTSLQYQIKQDKERLEKLQKRIQREQIKYEPARNVSKTYNEIDRMGQKTITGKMAISKEDYSELTALAKEGITSRAEISELEQSANYYRQKYFDSANALERMKTKYDELKEKCRPFLQALEHFPEVAKLFTEKVKQLFSFKEAQERAEKEAREKEKTIFWHIIAVREQLTEQIRIQKEKSNALEQRVQKKEKLLLREAELEKEEQHSIEQEKAIRDRLHDTEVALHALLAQMHEKEQKITLASVGQGEEKILALQTEQRTLDQQRKNAKAVWETEKKNFDTLQGKTEENDKRLAKLAKDKSQAKHLWEEVLQTEQFDTVTEYRTACQQIPQMEELQNEIRQYEMHLEKCCSTKEILEKNVSVWY